MILKSVRAPDQGQTSVFGKHCLPVCSALAFYTMQGLCFERKMDMPEHSGEVCVTHTVGAGLQWCLVQQSLPLLRCPAAPKLVLLQRWHCNCCMLTDGLVSCITSGLRREQPMLSTSGSYSRHACLFVTSLGLNNFIICLLACFLSFLWSFAMCVRVQHVDFCVCRL